MGIRVDRNELAGSFGDVGRVPLLPIMAHHHKQNMRDHLVAVQEVVAALAGDDFAAVERAAAGSASHRCRLRLYSA